MSNFYVVEESRSESQSCPEQYQVKADSPEEAVRVFLINNDDINLRDAGKDYEGWKKFTLHVKAEPEERNEDWYSLYTEY